MSVGHIYKITDSRGKYYIGSTIDYIKRSMQHEEAGENMLLKIERLKTNSLHTTCSSVSQSYKILYIRSRIGWRKKSA